MSIYRGGVEAFVSKWEIAYIISIMHRRVITICKHIIPKNAMSGTGITVRIDKSADLGIIVSGLQVVEPSLLIVVISTITQGVQVCQIAGLGNDVAEGVVLVCSNGRWGMCRWAVAHRRR